MLKFTIPLGPFNDVKRSETDLCCRNRRVGVINFTELQMKIYESGSRNVDEFAADKEELDMNLLTQ